MPDSPYEQLIFQASLNKLARPQSPGAKFVSKNEDSELLKQYEISCVLKRRSSRARLFRSRCPNAQPEDRVQCWHVFTQINTVVTDTCLRDRGLSRVAAADRKLLTQQVRRVYVATVPPGLTPSHDLVVAQERHGPTWGFTQVHV